MSTYHPPDLMSSGSPADYCWAMSDWYRDRGDLTLAQDWANAAQSAEEFEVIEKRSAQRLGELAAERENAQQTEERMMLGAAYLEAMDAGAI